MNPKYTLRELAHVLIIYKFIKFLVLINVMTGTSHLTVASKIVDCESSNVFPYTASLFIINVVKIEFTCRYAVRGPHDLVSTVIF